MAGVEITWLGQAGIRLRARAAPVVVIDPWFADHELRLYPPPSLDCIGDRLDLLLATHEHGDHLDLETLPQVVRRFPNVRVVVPTPLVRMVTQACPAATALAIEPQQRVAIDGLVIHGVPARHAVAMSDGYFDSARAPSGEARFVGYVVEMGGLRIYHGGDTLVSQSIVDRLKNVGVDVAILPVNGRDPYREESGIVGNMNAFEAVELCEAVGAEMLVPMHHDAVRGNTERAGAAADAAEAINAHVNVVNLARMNPIHVSADGRR